MAELLGGSLLGSIGSGLGSLFGAGASFASTQAGVGAVGDLTSQGAAMVAPYNFTGANYLAPIGQDLLGNNTGSQNIGNQRVNMQGNPLDFQDFAKNYNTSEGARYLMSTAQAAQNDTAASRGGLLSGANVRAQTGIAEGIANQDLMDQYKATLQGQQQDFAQREASYQNLYGQEAMGLQAGIAQAGTYAQGARAIGSLYGQQASNLQASGSGIGSALSGIFSGLRDAFK
jgi:hypothetical protein